MRRRFVKRSFGRSAKPALTWGQVSGAWLYTAQATTAATPLISLEMPATLVGVTADPPEDLTILRMVGTFGVAVTVGATPVSWTLGLIVQDATWTPSATFAADADKRVLWHETYGHSGANGTTAFWGFSATGGARGQVLNAALAATSCPERLETVDISPRVRVEPGQALYLVAWENANGGTLSTSTADMRVLFKRSRRR